MVRHPVTSTGLMERVVVRGDIWAVMYDRVIDFKWPRAAVGVSGWLLAWVLLWPLAPVTAMPISSQFHGNGWLGSGWVTDNGPGVLAGVAPDVDPILGRLPEQMGSAGDFSALEMSRTADTAPILRRQSRDYDFVRSLANRDFAGAEALATASGEQPLVDIGSDFDAFMRETRAAAEPRLDVPTLGQSELRLPGLPGEEGEEVTDAAPGAGPSSQPGQDTPILSALRLGTTAVEFMRPELRRYADLGRSVQELRDYLMVSDPLVGNMMMMDALQQRAIVVTEAGEGRPTATVSDEAASGGGKASVSRGPIFDGRPLLSVIWDFMTSGLAFVLYFILLVIWAAWRYFIRKYV